MRQAVLTFDAETMTEWGFAAFRDAGIRDVEVLSCDGASGVARIHVAEELDERRLDESDTIQWWEQVATDGAEYVYVVEGNAFESIDSVDTSALPRTERVTVHDGEFTLDYTGPQEAISEMVSGFEAAGIDVTLRTLRSYTVESDPLDALTDRQREVLEAAFARGYYDVPRGVTTAEIAADLGVDDSTVAEHLRRAERNLVTALLR